MSQPPAWIHARTLALVSLALTKALDDPEYLVVTAPFSLVIRKSPLAIRIPDLAVFEKQTIVEQDGVIHSAPRLIAEMLAPGENPEEILADYASIQVPEVWVISPEARTLEVLYAERGQLPKLFPHAADELTGIWPN